MVGVYFNANSKFYALGGRSMDGGGNDFIHPFEYDPVSNSWTIKSATYPDNQVNNMACGVLSDSGTPLHLLRGRLREADRRQLPIACFSYDPIKRHYGVGFPAPWPGNPCGITSAWRLQRVLDNNRSGVPPQQAPD